MMERTRIYEALKGVRGRRPVDLAALEQLLVRFSQLVVEQPWIKEIDINPLLASPERLIALDARIVLHDPAVTEADLPPGHPALPAPVRGVVDGPRRRAGHDPAHPPGGRAADGALPRRRCPTETVYAALLQHLGSASAPPTSA